MVSFFAAIIIFMIVIPLIGIFVFGSRLTKKLSKKQEAIDQNTGLPLIAAVAPHSYLGELGWLLLSLVWLAPYVNTMIVSSRSMYSPGSTVSVATLYTIISIITLVALLIFWKSYSTTKSNGSMIGLGLAALTLISKLYVLFTPM